MMVQFDIRWENSWRTPSAPYNYDAAWVFIKYRVAGGPWQHAFLNNTGHTAPVGSTITAGLLTPGTAFNAATNPGLGVFIYRDAVSTGAFTKAGVQLRWNYGNNSVADDAAVDIKIYAIEMINVPQSAYTVGSGGTESGSFTNGSWTTGATIPLSIGSENILTIGTAAGNLWGTSTSGDNSIGGTGSLAATFPKGFAAFYCMKYEISQQEYVDFLNSLTTTQATTRFPGQTLNRHGITVTGAVYSTNLPYVACNWLRWPDLAAYLDWSCLRPFTELEFEKACRGIITPVPNEYAWGTATVAADAYTLSDGGANNEDIATNYSITAGNASYVTTGSSINGPARVGIFSGASGNTGRVTAGTSFYGIMEMSGNVYERVVTVGNATGRLFTGVHGNGVIDATGNADATLWPGTDAIGAGFRGSGWDDSETYLRVSDRNYATRTSNSRAASSGGRGVRTAL